jgi:hypothetical protein
LGSIIVEWQNITALAIVAFAAIFVLRSGLRTIFGKKVGCGSGCGKCATSEQIAAPEVAGRIALPIVQSRT